jgi:hypothetical protein
VLSLELPLALNRIFPVVAVISMQEILMFPAGLAKNPDNEI